MEAREERLFKQFERPPFAPTYRPTEEEFRDPIAFIAKIKSDAEKYGVVKIKPPPSFLPPFAIDLERFEFMPRLQKLNELEAVSRVKINFINKVASFWHLQGTEFRIPVIDNKFIDLYQFHKLVITYGGYDAVTEQKKWSMVAKKLSLKPQHGSVLKNQYCRWLLPYDKLCQVETKTEDESDHDEKETMEEKKPRTRMMAGVGRMATRSAPVVVTRKKVHDPVENLVCRRCRKGDQEDLLLLCENCDGCLHTFCVDPPLSAVPRGEWRCSSCVAAAVAILDQQFGFEQSHRRYTLKQFGQEADSFKRAYFSPDNRPSLDRVETEFWRNVINLDCHVSVKYGADLFTTDVGSGFPRRRDHSRYDLDDDSMDAYYDHQWNLNNLPVLKNSVLSHINVDISGMMVPWVYVGMLFSTFCWHTEDHWSYSINYNHWGETKIWYGIPGAHGDDFERVMQEMVPELFHVQPDLLQHIVTMLNPRLLMARDIPVHTVHQHAGEFVVTFPRAYHAGFNEGFNFAEAVNFAPSDWLAMGRACVENYSLVRRQCVFSHDELVCGMATRADELDVGMAMACFEDVSRMARCEAEWRQSLHSAGLVKAERTVFEVLGDDHRQCHFCKTTLFLSAIACACSQHRLVCLRHANRLCSTCSMADCTLKYRYMLDEIPPLMNFLKERVKSFHSWRERVEAVVAGRLVPKPEVDDLRSLLDTARSQRLPQCAALDQLIKVLHIAEKHSNLASRIISNKIRTRKHQSALSGLSKKLQLDELQSFMQQLEDLPCVIPQASALKTFMDRVFEVQSKGEQALEQGRSQDLNQAIETLRKALDDALQLDMQLALIPLLKQELDQYQWILRVDRFCESIDDDEKDEEDDDRVKEIGLGLGSMDRLKSLIAEADRFPLNNETIEERIRRLQSVLDNAMANDHRAVSFLASTNPSLIEAETLLSGLLPSGSAQSAAVATLRRNVRNDREWSGRQRSVYMDRRCFHLRDLAQLKMASKGLQFCHEDRDRVEADHRRLVEFTNRIKTLFQKSISYYSVAEIIAPREDLCQLVEGQHPILSPHSPRTVHDDWKLLEEWRSMDDLNAHLDRLSAQQLTLLQALRKVNMDDRSGNGCVCVGQRPSTSLVSCRLCRNHYHEGCVQWDCGMDQLPGVGMLCVRCVRSRRPCIEDVLAACETAPEQSLELALVRHLLGRARRLHRDARQLLAELGNDQPLDLDRPSAIALRPRIADILLQMLGMEVVDSDLWPILYDLQSRLDPVSEEERLIHARLRARPVMADAAFALLFASPADMRRVKRATTTASSSSASVGSRKRNRTRSVTVFHEDNAQCAAPNCLQPVGDSVHWIMCERGCEKWFHLICVGLTVGDTRQLDAYGCFHCRPVLHSSMSAGCLS